MLELIEKVWNQRNFAALNDFIVRDVFLHSSGEATYIRPKGYIDETLRLLLAFPTARFEVRDIQTNFDNRYAGLRISVLWKMTGIYEGRPLYGPQTNQGVDLLGVSQFLIQGGRIIKERRLFDEIALRAQINATRGDQADVGAGQHLLLLTAPGPGRLAGDLTNRADEGYAGVRASRPGPGVWPSRTDRLEEAAYAGWCRAYRTPSSSSVRCGTSRRTPADRQSRVWARMTSA